MAFTKSLGPMKPQGDQGNAILSRAWERKGMETAL